MFELIPRPFDAPDFPARWPDAAWLSPHGWAHLVAGVAIVGAYSAMASALGFFVLRRRDMPFVPVVWLVVVFLFLGGLSHLAEVAAFWSPWHRLAGLVKVATALASWVTVLALAWAAPKALALSGVGTVGRQRRTGDAERERLEAGFRAVIELAPAAMMMADAAGRIVLVNTQAEATFGYGRDELLGRPVEILVPERYRAGHPALRQGFLAAPAARRVGTGRDLYALRKDGSELPVEIGISPISTAEGVFVLAAIVDIGARKAQEARLRQTAVELEQRVRERTAELEAERRAALGLARDAEEARRRAEHKEAELARANVELRFLNDVVEQSTQPFAAADSQGRLIRFNRAFERLTGYGPDELRAATWGQLIPGWRHEGEAGQVARPRATGEAARLEMECRRRDGSLVPVELTVDAYRGPDAAGPCLCAFLTDITERKQAEDRLRSAASFLDSIVESLPLMVFVKDAEALCFERLNRAGERLLGRPAAELVGKSDHELFPAEVADRFVAADREVLRNRKLVDVAEEVITTRHGTRVLHTRKVPILDDQGVPRHLLGISVDVTEMRRTEEQLRRLADELAGSNAELGQLAYVASHDLQEPLRLIASYLELLARRYQGRLDEKADRWIGFAVDAAGRMKQLINDLLEYSRVGTRGKPFQLVDCTRAFEAAVANLGQAVRESGAVITHGPLPTLAADMTQLVQLFQNLIGNAIKYRGAGPPEIHVEAARAPGAWQVSVRDNGIGIDPQHFERIFVIFQRLHTRAEYPGTGIGLALCRKIVERHGGRIWVESQPGQGTTFSFTIPDRKESPDEPT